MIYKNINIKIIAFVIISIAVLIGFYFRVKGLGKWPFALDEYYIFRSVQFILEKGVPEFDVGGYYTRGIIYQYITAGLVLIGLKAEFAARFFPVIINLCAIPALFKLGKKISNTTVATLLIMFFTFSLWEIELSRFARMYTFFQSIFIWYFYFYYKYLFENDNKSIRWILGLSFFSIFVYEASIFLVSLNFLLFFWNVKQKSFRINIEDFKNKIVIIIISIVIFLFAYFFLSYDFRTLNNPNLLPIELSDYFNNLPKEGKIKIPMILLLSSPLSITGIIFAFFIIVNTVIVTKRWFSKTIFNIYGKLSIIGLLILSATNLYGLFLISLIMFLLLEWINPRKFVKGEIKLLLMVIIGNFIAQNIYAIINSEWQTLITYRLEPNIIGNIKILLKEFLNFPNFYELFALFRDTYKLHTFISVLILLIGTFLVIAGDDVKLKKNRIFFMLFILLLLAITILNTKYFTTRYFFFLFPLFYLYILISLEKSINIFIKKEKIKNIIVFTIGILFFLISEDSNSSHLVMIDSPEINFRKTMTFKQRDHFYPRWDSRSTSEIVNKISKKNDLIISNEQISGYYLKRLDYLYRNYMSNDFKIESVNNGKNERWTNAKLIYKYDDLIKILSDKEKTKWLLINKTYIHELEEKGLFKLIDKFLYFRSNDGTSFIYKITTD